MNKNICNSHFNFKNALIVFSIFSVVGIIIDIKYRYLFWFNSSFILFLIIIASPILIVVAFGFEGFTKKRFDVSKFSILIPVACVVSIIGGNYVSEIQAGLSKKTAEPIINAVERYKTNYGQYPANLTDLIPEYIDDIPDSKMGWCDVPYKYEKSAMLSYSIYFPSDEEELWKYESGFKSWLKVQD